VIPWGAILSLTALGVSGFLAVYVLGINPRGPANRAFFLLMLSFVLWDACEAVARAMAPGTPPDVVYPWIIGVWIGISILPSALIHLALTYPERHPAMRHPWLLAAVYAPVLGWAYLFFRTDDVIAGVSSNAFGPSARVGEPYLLFALLYSVGFYVGVALFVRAWWRVRKSALARTQAIVVAGLLLGTIPGGVTEIFWPVLTASDTRLGLGSLYTLLWSIFFAFVIARYRYFSIEPVTEAAAASRAKHPLERGLNYLVLEPGRSVSMGAFREIVSETPGICVTGLPPSRVAARFGLERTPVLWITNASTNGRTVRPQGLDFELVHTILKFLRENPGTAVLLDDVDYLASVAGFEAVARFVKRVANQASASRGTLIVTAGPATLSAEELAILGGCVDRIVEAREDWDSEGPRPGDPALLLMSPADVAASLPLLGVRGGLLLTTEHPTKARRRFGEAFQVLWLTEHPEAGTPCVRPSALDTEGKRALASYVTANPGSGLVLVGLEQLFLFNTFPKVLAFVKDTLDLAALHGGRLVVSLAPNALPPRQVAMLVRRFDAPVVHGRLKSSLLGEPPIAAPGNRTPHRGPAS